MISDQLKDTLVEEIIKGLIGSGTEGLKPVLELLFNTAMKVEREQKIVKDMLMGINLKNFKLEWER